MDKNQVIGFVLIFALFMVWSNFFAPSPTDMEAQRQYQDSIANADLAAEQAKAEIEAAAPLELETPEAPAVSDSTLLAQRGDTFGAFAAATVGEEVSSILENDMFKITFSNKGGRITSVEMKHYFKQTLDSLDKPINHPLYLMEDEKNKFDFLLPMNSVASGAVRSGDLFFTPTIKGNTISFRADIGEGRYVEQVYAIQDSTYLIDYDVRFEGLQHILSSNTEAIQLDWVNYLDKIEINESYERNYTSIYFKPTEDDADRCSCTSSDKEELSAQPIKWVSGSNQFFNSTLIADDKFSGLIAETVNLEETDEDLKILKANLSIPYGRAQTEQFGMQFYIGPNEFDRMQAIGYDFTDVIPYGRSIFGAINRWMIRPIFNFFDGIIGNKGIAILLLTLLVKLLVFPLTYKMLRSQSKMAALKPYLEKAKDKNKDDAQAQQMETMKMYREYGVNPLGGCFPMFLQLPIWFALYRYFPAAITFRQESFLWAHDLSSYDIFARLPFGWDIPMFGSHLSLFAILWAVTTLIYTFYNTKHMDFGANPAMKYFQYIMPIMFVGFFNGFASGLTCYLFFSNLINISQTVITKNFIIDQEALKAELEENKKKPKKKGGFQDRLQNALKEQQKKQAEIEAARKKEKRKKKK